MRILVLVIPSNCLTFIRKYEFDRVTRLFRCVWVPFMAACPLLRCHEDNEPEYEDMKFKYAWQTVQNTKMFSFLEKA